MKWSHYQEAVLGNFERGVGHTMVKAVAGSGKTTVLEEGVKRSPARNILMCAFSKPIEQELRRRLPYEKYRNIDVRTTHGLALRMCNQRFDKLDIDRGKGRDIARMVCAENRIDGYSETGRYTGKMKPPPHYTLEKLAGLAKNLWASADDLDQLARIAREFDLDADELISPRLLAEMCRSCMYRASQDTARIDFDDMIWFPVIYGIEMRYWNEIVVDETQDLNKLQLQLLFQLMREGGRIVAIGDQRQGIYGFRGADMGAMAHIQERTAATVLPLSISYRCAQLIAQEARAFEPTFEAAPGAPKGVVDRIGSLDLKSEVPDEGDCFVLSRRKAPLVTLCLKLLRRGKKAQIQGKDLGEGLERLAKGVRKKGDNNSITLFRDRVQAFNAKEEERLIDQDKRERLEELKDQTGALMALADDVRDVPALFGYLKKLFSDIDDKKVITLSTVHRAKGLERDRVFMLKDTFSQRNEEEINLGYVATTRAKTHLTYVYKENR